MENKLLELAKQIESCQRCDLYKDAKKAVPGAGNPESDILFIGEAPGFNEDAQGLPFVGNAGKYLDNLLTKIGLSRKDVFITNVVKHRPPENRDPSFSEIAACNPWLEEQLTTIEPKVIVTLGRLSLNYFLPNAKISAVHGHPYRVRNCVVLPMYHPAAALRRMQIATELDSDFKKNQELLNKPELSRQITELYQDGGQNSLF
jgi:uracil-DNA glycosylase family 4